MEPRPDGLFACQETRRLELRRAFLLLIRSLVKCIPDRPIQAGVIVMALPRVATRDIKNQKGLGLRFVPLYPRR